MKFVKKLADGEVTIDDQTQVRKIEQFMYLEQVLVSCLRLLTLVREMNGPNSSRRRQSLRPHPMEAFGTNLRKSGRS